MCVVPLLVEGGVVTEQLETSRGIATNGMKFAVTFNSG